MTSEQTSVQLPQTGTYVIQPASSNLEFTTRHMFGLAGVRGTFELTSGEITIADPPTESTATATASAGSFDTRNAKRDEHVKSKDLLNHEDHPEITFRSTGLSQRDGRWVLRGDLTARGGTAPVELTVEDFADDGRTLTARAVTTVDRYAHGITKLKGMAGRRLKMSITVRAVKS
jgi:polyisoprenoid-binding protein YceI